MECAWQQAGQAVVLVVVIGEVDLCYGSRTNGSRLEISENILYFLSEGGLDQLAGAGFIRTGV